MIEHNVQIWHGEGDEQTKMCFPQQAIHRDNVDVLHETIQRISMITRLARELQSGEQHGPKNPLKLSYEPLPDEEFKVALVTEECDGDRPYIDLNDEYPSKELTRKEISLAELRGMFE